MEIETKRLEDGKAFKQVIKKDILTPEEYLEHLKLKSKELEEKIKRWQEDSQRSKEQ